MRPAINEEEGVLRQRVYDAMTGYAEDHRHRRPEGATDRGDEAVAAAIVAYVKAALRNVEVSLGALDGLERIAELSAAERGAIEATQPALVYTGDLLLWLCVQSGAAA